MIDHDILGDLDYIQHSARAGVRRFTSRRSCSIPSFPPFYAEECSHWFKYPHRLLENLHTSSTFTWNISAGYVSLV